MKKIFMAVFLTVTMVISCFAAFEPNIILVKPATKNEQGFQSLITSHGARQIDSIEQINVRVIQVPERAYVRVYNALQRNPNIAFAEPNWIRELAVNDPLFSQQWHIPNIKGVEAWGVTTGNVVIAILDTGVDGEHPDLKDNMILGWNVYNQNDDSRDVHGHGTAVAGSASAVGNNAIGLSSIAYTASIMPIRVSGGDGRAQDSHIARGLIWAADNGARVANISYGVHDGSTIASAAKYFQEKGGVVVNSAGNSGAETFGGGSSPEYLVTVSATGSNNTRTSWSSYGSPVDLAAPGSNIYTTVRGGTYSRWNGTSFSAPIVAGVAALVFSVNPNLTPLQVIEILKLSADDLGSVGWDPYYGWGKVNAYNAVLLAKELIIVDPVEPPIVDPVDPEPEPVELVVVITSPQDGDAVSGNVRVGFQTTSEYPLVRLDLWINEDNYSSTRSNFINGKNNHFRWNTRGSKKGENVLFLIAEDEKGSIARSKIITVIVK